MPDRLGAPARAQELPGRDLRPRGLAHAPPVGARVTATLAANLAADGLQKGENIAALEARLLRQLPIRLAELGDHDRDGGLLHDDSGAPLVFDGQREAARAICQMQGLWPEKHAES